jgi:hypothetical protein
VLKIVFTLKGNAMTTHQAKISNKQLQAASFHKPITPDQDDACFERGYN